MEYLVNNWQKLAKIAAGVIILGVLILMVVDFLKNASLSVLVVPTDAEVLVDGRKIGNGTHRFFPGEISIEIRRAGFKTKSLRLKLESNQTKTLHQYLVGEDGNFGFYKREKEEYETLKLVANDEQSLKFILDFEKQAKIRSVLPITYHANDGSRRYVHIANGNDEPTCKQQLCLTVVDTINDNLTVRRLIKEAGFEMGDYQIIKKVVN